MVVIAAAAMEEFTALGPEAVQPTTTMTAYSSQADDAASMEPKPLHIDALPDELLLLIFARIADGATLLDCVPLVCRRWQCVSRERLAWAGVVATAPLCDHHRVRSRPAALQHFEAAEAVRVARLAPALRHVCLLATRPPQLACEHRDALLEALRSQSGATWEVRVELAAGEAWEKQMDGILELLRQDGDRVCALGLRGLRRPDAALWRALCEVLRGLERLRRLELQAEALPYAGELAGARLPQLTQLIVSLSHTADAQAAFLADAVRASVGTLEHLEVVDESEAWTGDADVDLAVAECRALRFASLPLASVAAVRDLPLLRCLRVAMDTDYGTELRPSQRAALAASVNALRRCRPLAALRELRVAARFIGLAVTSDTASDSYGLVLAAFAGLGAMAANATRLHVSCSEWLSAQSRLLTNLLRPMAQSLCAVHSLYVPAEALPALAAMPRLRWLAGEVVHRKRCLPEDDGGAVCCRVALEEFVRLRPDVSAARLHCNRDD